MKKTASIILIISMLASMLFTANVSAEGEKTTVGYLTFTEYDTYCEVTGCDESATGDIVIPSSVDFNGASLPVTSIGAWAFLNCSSITSITIPDSVTSIGDYAFLDCNKLEKLYYSGSEEQWDEITVGAGSSFYYLSIIKNIYFIFNYKGEIIKSELLTYTDFDDHYEVSRCDTFTAGDIVIPSTYTMNGKTLPVTSIGDSAFGGCSKLTSINLPDTVEHIGDAAFLNCKNLTSIKLPKKITELPNTFLSDIKEYLGEWGFGVFQDCINLETIILPVSLTHIYPYTFKNCDNLKTVYYTGSEEQWNEIIISYGNTPLEDAEIFFNYVIPEDQKSGDMNGDNETDNKDVVVLFRYVSGGVKDEDESVYDFNGDGEVNNKDVVALFRFLSAAQ